MLDTLLDDDMAVGVDQADLVERPAPVDSGEHLRCQGGRVVGDQWCSLTAWPLPHGRLRRNLISALHQLVGAAPADRCEARRRPGWTGLHLDLEGDTSA